jgi:phosphoribosylglycinamide formyltransferase-1
MNCAVFASGGGTNFQSLLDRKDSGDLHVNFVLMVGNNSSAGAFERARAHGIPAVHIAPSHFTSEQQYTERLCSLLKEKNVECIVLAGYMKKLPAAVVAAYPHRILNIHPALLTSFGGKGLYGIKVHQAVLEYGAKVTGVTVHLVDEEYDHGPVLMQHSVEVLDTDTAETLAHRVLEVEHALYWRALEAVAGNRVRVEGRRAFVSQ